MAVSSHNTTYNVSVGSLDCCIIALTEEEKGDEVLYQEVTSVAHPTACIHDQ